MCNEINVQPGKEEEFRHLQGWLAFSDRVDRLIEATEAPGETERGPAPAPVLGAVGEAAAARPAGRQTVVGRLARRAGRVLRRIGEGLEAWGSGVSGPCTGARASR